MKVKTIVITGANSGIGYYASLKLAKLGHRVIMVCRNHDRACKSALRIKEESGNNNIHYLIADLSDVDSIKNLVNTLLEKYKDIDVLINNAADFDIANKKANFNTSGLEKQFTTNVLAPFILSELLVPVLREREGKVINISTKGLVVFPNIKLDFDNLNAEISYRADKIYYQNKLALLMLTMLMNRKYEEVIVQAIRVTNVKIDISRYPNLNPILKFMYKVKSRFAISPEDMADVYVDLALNNHEGLLFDEHMREVRANKYTYDAMDQERLYTYVRSVLNMQLPY